jgi:hypothetical protein
MKKQLTKKEKKERKETIVQVVLPMSFLMWIFGTATYYMFFV